MTPQNPTILLPSSREHWIDISRFLAACLIVCVHAPAFSFASLFQLPVFNGRVAFFLILAGYFMGRNNSWNKAFKRGYTLLIPFLFWNIVISFLHPGIMNMGLPEYLCNLAGFRSLFTPDFIPLSINGLTGEPFSPPTWFLRDIILCSLISPILLKLKYPVFVLILICFSTDWLQYPVPANKVTLAPSTVSLFSLGLFLSSIKLAEVKHVYKNSFTPLVLLAVGTGFLLSITNYLSVCQNNPEWNMHKILASYGVWNISWPAVHLNSLCPVFGALLLMALGNLAGKENSRCQKAVQLCSRLFPDIRSSLSFDHADPLPHLETILFRSLCINTGHHFPDRRILSFPEKILPGLPALRRQRPHHPCSQKKLRPVSSFFF